MLLTKAPDNGQPAAYTGLSFQEELPGSHPGDAEVQADHFISQAPGTQLANLPQTQRERLMRRLYRLCEPFH
jgi:hypothetical protein